jgi:hypothetical protein
MSGVLKNGSGSKSYVKQPGDGAVKTGMDTPSSKAGAGKSAMESAEGQETAKKPLLTEGGEKAGNQEKAGQEPGSNPKDSNLVHTPSGDKVATGDYSSKEKEDGQKVNGPDGQTTSAKPGADEKTGQKGDKIADNPKTIQKGDSTGPTTKITTGDEVKAEKEKDTAIKSEGLHDGQTVKAASDGNEKIKKPVEKVVDVDKEKETVGQKEGSDGPTVKVAADGQKGNAEKQKDTAVKEGGVPVDQSTKVASGASEKTGKTTEKGNEVADNGDVKLGSIKETPDEKTAKVPTGGNEKQKEATEKGNKISAPPNEIYAGPAEKIGGQDEAMKDGGQKEATVKGEGKVDSQAGKIASAESEKTVKIAGGGETEAKGKAAADVQKGAKDGPTVKVAVGDQGGKAANQKEGAGGEKGVPDGGTGNAAEKGDVISDKTKGYPGAQKEAIGEQGGKVANGDQVNKVDGQKAVEQKGASDIYPVKIGSANEGAVKEGKDASTKVAAGDQVKKVDGQKAVEQKGASDIYPVKIGSADEDAIKEDQDASSKEKAPGEGGAKVAEPQVKDSEKQKGPDTKENSVPQEQTTKVAAGGSEKLTAAKQTEDKGSVKTPARSRRRVGRRQLSE